MSSTLIVSRTSICPWCLSVPEACCKYWQDINSLLQSARVFLTVRHFHPSQIFAGITLKVEFCQGLHSGRLQPCLQILD